MYVCVYIYIYTCIPRGNTQRCARAGTLIVVIVISIVTMMIIVIVVILIVIIIDIT